MPFDVVYIQRNDLAAYPTELNVFADKRMLFKIEVNDANLFRNWRSYAVKKLTDSDEIIKNFLTLHGICVSSEYRECLIIPFDSILFHIH